MQGVSESKPSSLALPPSSHLPIPPGSQLSPSTEARTACSAVPLQLPSPRGQPFSTGSFAIFILAFTICLPRCLLLLQLPPGDSTKTAASFPRPPSPRRPCRPLRAPGAAHHCDVRATRTSWGTNQQADKTKFHLRLWSIHLWLVTLLRRR